MKLLRLGLRFWITLASIFSFLVGWVLLAQVPMPNQSGAPGQSSGSSLPTLQPLRPLPGFGPGDDDNFGNQPFFNVQPRNQSRPFFSTGGS